MIQSSSFVFDNNNKRFTILDVYSNNNIIPEIKQSNNPIVSIEKKIIVA